MGDAILFFCDKQVYISIDPFYLFIRLFMIN